MDRRDPTGGFRCEQNPVTQRRSQAWRDALQRTDILYRCGADGVPVFVQAGAPSDDELHALLHTVIGGFSLHAAVRVEAHERKRLEQLCRYITRPALANERVQLNDAGQVELKLKTPWRDATTHLVMSPLEFMQRLAALLPRPRLRLTG